MNIEITTIPNSPYIALAKDKNLTPKAIERGTIIIEDEIAALPEVQALNGGVVVDIGAYICDTALIFANHGCSVLAFESQLDAGICAQYNADAYNREHPDSRRITVFNTPVGDGGYVRLNQDGIDGNLGTRTVSKIDDFHSGVSVKSICIDDIPLTRLDFYKCDIEGQEPMAILGSMNTLRKFHPMVLVEVYHEMLERQGYKSDDIYKLLTNDAGYNKWRVAIGRDDEPRFDVLFWKE